MKRPALVFPGLVLALILFGRADLASAGGDVMVGGVDPKGGIRINGDAKGNDITVTQNANGTVTVKGNGGTTVNGGTKPVTTGKVTGKIKINMRGGDDKTTVTGVKSGGLEVKDEVGKNEIVIKKSDVKGKLKIRNEDGSIDLDDVKWGKRDIKKGKGTINPAGADGKGGAGSAPPKSPGGKKAARKKAAKKAPLEAQDDALPTSNPGRGGLLPDVPEIPHHSTPAPSKGGSYGPKGSYPSGPPSGWSGKSKHGK